MIRTRTLSFLAATAIASMVCAQAGDGAVNLRPRWVAGQTSVYEFWGLREQSTTTSFGGETNDTRIAVDSEGEVTWRVERVRADGSSTCSMTLDWILATYELPDGRKLKSDTRKGSGEPESMFDRLRAMSGVALTVEVAADGSITKVTGIEKMKRKADDPDAIPEQIDFIEIASDLATLVAAPARIEPGRNWKTDFRWTHELGHMDHDVTYTLMGVENIEGIPLATVNGKARLKLDVDRSNLPQDGPRVDIRLVEGSVDSQVLFDLQRHEAVGRNAAQTEVIEMTMSLPRGTVKSRSTTSVQSQLLRISEE